jgi:hypothetical protein
MHGQFGRSEGKIATEPGVQQGDIAGRLAARRQFEDRLCDRESEPRSMHRDARSLRNLGRSLRLWLTNTSSVRV